MCIHVKAAFDWLQIKHGNNYFESFKDWDKEKAKLLEEYGLKPEDEEVKEVEFYNDYYGNLKMKVPAWLWGKHAETSISDFKKSLVPQNNTHLFAERPKLTKSEYRYLILEVQTSKVNPKFGESATLGRNLYCKI